MAGWKGWQDRVAADPQFVYKVVIEQVIGVSASVVGDMASRPNWGLKELDFVFATLVVSWGWGPGLCGHQRLGGSKRRGAAACNVPIGVRPPPRPTRRPGYPRQAARPLTLPGPPPLPQVGSIVNFALMYLLAPVASASGAGAQLGLVQKVFGEHYLRAWAAPTGHMFEPGFALGARAVNFAYKGAVFAFIGMCAGLVGTATSNGLLELRKKMDPAFQPPVGGSGMWWRWCGGCGGRCGVCAGAQRGATLVRDGAMLDSQQSEGCFHL